MKTKKSTSFGPIRRIVTEQQRLRKMTAAREKDLSLVPSSQLAKNGQSNVFTSPLNFGYFFSLYEIIGRQIKAVSKKKKPKVLEIGCGTGWGSFYLARKFPKTEFLATNIDRKSIDYASRIYRLENLTFSYLNGLEQKKFHQQFDLVFFVEVIEHLKEKEQILLINQSLASLKEKGLVIFSTPLRESLWGLPTLGWPNHIKEYSSASELESFLKENFPDRKIQINLLAGKRYSRIRRITAIFTFPPLMLLKRFRRLYRFWEKTAPRLAGPNKTRGNHSWQQQLLDLKYLPNSDSLKSKNKIAAIALVEKG